MHPYGISVLVPQMSFCGETRVIVTKCKLLYQPSSLHKWFHHKLVKKKKSPVAVTVSIIMILSLPLGLNYWFNLCSFMLSHMKENFLHFNFEKAHPSLEKGKIFLTGVSDLNQPQIRNFYILVVMWGNLNFISQFVKWGDDWNSGYKYL